MGACGCPLFVVIRGGSHTPLLLLYLRWLQQERVHVPVSLSGKGPRKQSRFRGEAESRFRDDGIRMLCMRVLWPG